MCHSNSITSSSLGDGTSTGSQSRDGRNSGTTSAIITVLRDLGWNTVYGPELHEADARLGVPSAEVLAVERERAVSQGADSELVEVMGDGFTGVLGVLETWRPGPVVCFRFDIDSNDLVELADETHRPFSEGFASINDGAMHGCGHDGHAAIGLGLATTLTKLQNELSGTVKIIFQPAEEGVRGAHSIVAAGWFDDVDLFVATHLKSDDGKGNVLTGSDGYLASTKLDVTFTGVGSHAGGDPEKGNVLLAAASATLNLHAIPRHSEGASRINVGTFQAGEGRNVVPRTATLRVETRGESSAINSFMYDRAQEVIAGAARMYDVDASVTVVGKADQESPSPELLPYIRTCFEGVDGVAEIRDAGGLGGRGRDRDDEAGQGARRPGHLRPDRYGYLVGPPPNASTSTRTCSVSEWKLRPLLRLVRGSSWLG